MSAFVVDTTHIDAMLTAGLYRGVPHYDLRWTVPGVEDVSPGGGARLAERGYGPECEASFGYVFRTLTQLSVDHVGAMLLAECQRSVNHRYDEDELEPVYTFRPLPGSPDPVTVLKAIDCYEYQACEHDEWTSSEAWEFCQALRKHMIGKLRGYDDAPWEITDRDVFRNAESVKRINAARARGAL